MQNVYLVLPCHMFRIAQLRTPIFYIKWVMNTLPMHYFANVLVVWINFEAMS